MKKLLLLAVIVICSVYSGNLFATPTPVRVLASNFSISGDAQCYHEIDLPCPGGYGPFDLNYSGSGTGPLTHAIEIPEVYDGPLAYSSAGFFYVDARSYNAPTAHAYASAEWTFSPLTAMDSLGIHAGLDLAWASYYIKLVDLTEMTDIFNISGIGEELIYLIDIDNNNLAYLMEHSFQPNHRYKLSLSVGTYANYDSSEILMWTNDLIPTVPEPTTLLLLGLGLMGLAGVRRKIEK